MKNYISTLNGWRAIAILIVLLAHSADSIGIFLQSSPFFNAEYIETFGKEGVNIFFGLSGFLITSRLISEETEYGRISLNSFYIRRGFRILPAALIFISVIGMLSIFGIINVSLTRWFCTIFFLANYCPSSGSWYLGHFWSLAVEEHFYFIWPFAFLLLGTSIKRLRFAIISAFVIGFWRMLDFKYQITGATAASFWARTDIQVDNILWGVIFAIAYANDRYKVWLNKLLSSTVSFAILIVVFVCIIFAPNLNWKIGFVLLTVKAITIPLLMIWTSTHKTSLISKLLESKPFNLLGKISYSLYLWQQLFLAWNKDMVSSLYYVQLFPYNIIIAIFFATLSYILIEKPLIKIGHKIANKHCHR